MKGGQSRGRRTLLPTSGTVLAMRGADSSHRCTGGKRWQAGVRPWQVDGRGARKNMTKYYLNIVCTTRHCVQNPYDGHEGQPQRRLRRESLWNASDAPKSRPQVLSPAHCDGLKVLNPHQSNYGGRISRRDAFEGFSRPSELCFVPKK